MEKILNFLILSIKWLSKAITQVKPSSTEEKFVTSELALEAIDLSLAQWVFLHWQYSAMTRVKRSERLREAHDRVKAAMAKYQELKGFGLTSGNPYLHLMSACAMTREELIAKYGDRVRVINASLVKQLTVVILTYNFFKKYRERAGELFTKAESDMRDLVQSNQLPGRFSWNNFVEKIEKEKTVADFSFMDEYKPVDLDEADSSKNDDKSEEGQAPSSEDKPSGEQLGDQAQGESSEGSQGI